MNRWTDPRELGAHIRARRCELEISQEQLAERAGTAPTVVARLERGSRVPPLATLARILDVLGQELLVGTRPAPSSAAAA